MKIKLLTPKEFGQKLNPPVSARRVVEMCNKGQLPEAQKIGKVWVIHENAKDPRDKRYMK